eukprot:9152-Heterococcus_DN1.PRE.4
MNGLSCGHAIYLERCQRVLGSRKASLELPLSAHRRKTSRSLALAPSLLSTGTKFAAPEVYRRASTPRSQIQ